MHAETGTAGRSVAIHCCASRRLRPSRASARATLLARAACLVWLVATAGCGAAFYEERLSQTARQFAYYHTLNENLGEKWGSAGLEIRLPKQFKPDLVAQSFTGPDGQPQHAFVPRQPAYFAEDVTLPGLVGSWQADVNSASAGGNATAWLYVMTNREMFLDDSTRNEAPVFHTLVLEALCNGARIEPPQDTRPPWNEDTFPPFPTHASRSFAATHNTFNWISLTPSQPVDGLVREFRLYLHVAGDIQTAYLYVTPTDVSASERIPERIELSFETLKVDATIPQRGPEGGAAPEASQF